MTEPREIGDEVGVIWGLGSDVEHKQARTPSGTETVG